MTSTRKTNKFGKKVTKLATPVPGLPISFLHMHICIATKTKSAFEIKATADINYKNIENICSLSNITREKNTVNYNGALEQGTDPTKALIGPCDELGTPPGVDRAYAHI